MMETILNRVLKLLSVKSIVTLTLTAVFAWQLRLAVTTAMRLIPILLNFIPIKERHIMRAFLTYIPRR